MGCKDLIIFTPILELILIPFRLGEYLHSISAISSPLYIFLFFIFILPFIFFNISIIPVLELLTFTFLIKISEFSVNNVRTIKNEAELISPGIV